MAPFMILLPGEREITRTIVKSSFKMFWVHADGLVIQALINCQVMHKVFSYSFKGK